MGVALVLGILCSVLACFLAAYQIGMHLVYYNSPPFQRHIIRIIFMVPVYAICSVVTLAQPENAVYVSTIRDCYEAWILYNFHSLCLLYVGGPGEIETRSQGKIVEPSYVLMTCCFPPLPVDGKLLRQCKQATLQFVLAKPFLAAAIICLEAFDNYSEGDFSPTKGYVYVMLVMNVCYAVALYGLIIFYLAAQDLLKPFKPVVKFVLIKGVIFFTFWQGFVLALLTSVGVVESAHEALKIQNMLICIEMFVASICTLFAFPHKQYIVHDAKSLNMTNLGGKLSHAISFTDVVSDTFHQFAPAYHDYTLYAETENDPGANKAGGLGAGSKKRFRAKTYLFKDLENIEEMMGGNGGGGKGYGINGKGDISILHRDSIADNALLMFQRQEGMEQLEPIPTNEEEDSGEGNSASRMAGESDGEEEPPATIPASIEEDNPDNPDDGRM